jgi:hypothetical protein
LNEVGNSFLRRKRSSKSLSKTHLQQRSSKSLSKSRAEKRSISPDFKVEDTSPILKKEAAENKDALRESVDKT